MQNMSLNSIKVSIIIPCFNEKDSIQKIIDDVKKSPVPNKEIIVVDDFSNDGTREILQQYIEKLVDKILYHDKNQGKGAALRTGIEEVTGDVVIIQDADLEYNPAEYSILLKPIIEGKADVVYGSRFLSEKPRRVLYWHFIANKFLTTLSNMFTNLNLSDMETCYKVFKREIIQSIKIEENRFGFEPEITAKIAKMKCRIFEVGISYNGRTYLEGKKINWKDGISAIRCILKYNLLR